MEVRRVGAVDAVEFQEKVWSKREPAILCGLDLGKAQDLWSPEYLSNQVGSQPVKVHVCPEPQMDFITKNFVYRFEVCLWGTSFVHKLRGHGMCKVPVPVGMVILRARQWTGRHRFSWLDVGMDTVCNIGHV